MSYVRLPSYYEHPQCDYCFTPFKFYNVKWNKQKLRCVLNDNRSVIFYSNDKPPLKILYSDIKRIEKRGWMKMAFVLKENEIVIKCFKKNTMFNHLKRSFLAQ